MTENSQLAILDQPGTDLRSMVTKPFTTPMQRRSLLDLTDQQAERLRRLAEICTATQLSYSKVNKRPAKYEDIFLILVKGLELGFEPMAALDLIDAIHGRPTLKPQGMLALIYHSGELERFAIDPDEDEQVCIVLMKRRGYEPHVQSFSMQDAIALDLADKTNWRQQPMNMMKWRAVGAACRVTFPDIIQGMYMPEEMMPDAIVNQDGEIIELPPSNVVQGSFSKSDKGDTDESPKQDSPSQPQSNDTVLNQPATEVIKTPEGQKRIANLFTEIGRRQDHIKPVTDLLKIDLLRNYAGTFGELLNDIADADAALRGEITNVSRLRFACELLMPEIDDKGICHYAGVDLIDHIEETFEGDYGFAYDVIEAAYQAEAQTPPAQPAGEPKPRARKRDDTKIGSTPPPAKTSDDILPWEGFSEFDMGDWCFNHFRISGAELLEKLGKKQWRDYDDLESAKSAVISLAMEQRLPMVATQIKVSMDKKHYILNTASQIDVYGRDNFRKLDGDDQTTWTEAAETWTEPRRWYDLPSPVKVEWRRSRTGKAYAVKDSIALVDIPF